MKDKKNILDSLRQAKQTVSEADKALNGAIQELNDDMMDAVTGAGNPFGDVPRNPTQPIDPGVRGNG